MKKIKNLCLSAIAMLLAVGCSSDNESHSGIIVPGDKMTIDLSISGMSTEYKDNTRAGVDPINENQIKDVRVFFVRGENVILNASDAMLENNKVIIRLNKEKENELSSNWSDIYVVANIGKYDTSSITTLAQLKAFTYESSFNANNPSHFVMSGVSKDFKLDEGVRNAKLVLERAASKISFSVSLDPKLFDVDAPNVSGVNKMLIQEIGVKFRNFNNKTYLFPMDDSRLLGESLGVSQLFGLTALPQHLSYDLNKSLYSYAHVWAHNTEADKGVAFDVSIKGLVNGKQDRVNYVVYLGRKDNYSGLELKPNKHYNVNAFINRIPGYVINIDGDLVVGDWEDVDVDGDVVLVEEESEGPVDGSFVVEDWGNENVNGEAGDITEK